MGLVCAACTPVHVPSDQANTVQIDVTDRYGNRVQLQKPAQRIVCLFEASVDDLYMLGAGSALVGIPAKIYSAPDLYRAYSILDRRIAQKQIATPSNWEASTNIESVVALQPDLVVVNAGQTDVIKVLQKMQIPVYAVMSENLQQTRKELHDLGTLTGRSKRAQQLLQFIDAEIAAMNAKKHNTTQQKTVYYGWSGGRIFSTSGIDSMPNTVMTLAGARNVVTTSIDQPNVNPEKLLEWNPDVILLWNSRPEQIYERPELSTLSAVRQRQVYSLRPAFLFNPHTPKILLAANQLQHWLSGSVDVHQDAAHDMQRILSEFYGATHAAQLIHMAQSKE
ncbi:ABC transporter substrate-binding protein [uncultured Acinetobacter sp.]|uniref:ABC transporter substrate-binding protein n=1 Tax=uncultured Acinetobacter sp. TaxID=165433 RepID=UPI00258E07F0|nr:ABC transporter substrate-binding protein [uncultured Acinetobacter sp.]